MFVYFYASTLSPIKQHLHYLRNPFKTMPTTLAPHRPPSVGPMLPANDYPKSTGPATIAAPSAQPSKPCGRILVCSQTAASLIAEIRHRKTVIMSCSQASKLDWQAGIYSRAVTYDRNVAVTYDRNVAVRNWPGRADDYARLLAKKRSFSDVSDEKLR